MKDKYRLRIPRLSILSQSELKLIHASTLEVLRRTGIAVREPKAIELLKQGGCWVEGERVKMPAHLVERALRDTPPRIAMCDRAGSPAMFLQEGYTYFGTGSDTPYVIDARTDERREALLRDIENVSKVVDALDETSFVMCGGIASDVKPEISDIYHFEAMLNNTEKPIVFTAWSLQNLKTIVEMAEIVAGGGEKLRLNPFLALYNEPISPLQLAEEAAQKLMFMAKKSLPVVFTPAVLTGATGPTTIAGGLIQANAEMLGGYVLANLIREGAPFIFGGAVTPFDMGTCIATYAAPEYMLAACALADLARFYRLPTFTVAGCSDSNSFDEQASLEAALWVLLSSLNAGNLVHDVGYIDSGLTTSLAQLVVSDEVIGLVRRITGRFEIDEETMALDLIHQVGPGGEYLTSEHTLRHFKENWFPGLISRLPYERWVKEGKKDLKARAKEKVIHILETHNPRPLDEGIRTELRKIIQSVNT